ARHDVAYRHSRRSPRSTRFPYTTLFRSLVRARRQRAGDQRDLAVERHGLAVHGADEGVATAADHGAAQGTCSDLGHLRTASLGRSEEHTSELQSRENIVCRLLLEKKNNL